MPAVVRGAIAPLAALLAVMALAVGSSASARRAPAAASAAHTVTAIPGTVASPVRIATVGDSLTCAGPDNACPVLGGYRAQLDRDLAAAGVPHEFVVVAKGGQTCQWVADQMPTVVAQHPDTIIAWCGKHDAGYKVTRSATTAALESIASQALAAGVGVYFPYQNYSDLSIIDRDRVDREADVNNAINDVVNEPRFMYKIAAMDLTIVPGDAFHITSDGVHPTQRGYDAVGREMYRNYLWNLVHGPQLSSLCGMYGHWRLNPRPAAQSCTLTPAP